MIVGGEGELYPANTDHLAVQRGLINCAPKIFACLKKRKIKYPAEFTVSFDLTPSEKLADASNFKFSWPSAQNDQANQCLAKIWSDTQYGLMIKETTKINMPIKIK